MLWAAKVVEAGRALRFKALLSAVGLGSTPSGGKKVSCNLGRMYWLPIVMPHALFQL
jgi:hypothetical protein